MGRKLGSFITTVAPLYSVPIEPDPVLRCVEVKKKKQMKEELFLNLLFYAQIWRLMIEFHFVLSYLLLVFYFLPLTILIQFFKGMYELLFLLSEID